MKRFFISLLLVSRLAGASDEFAAEEQIENPDKIPASIIALLAHKIDLAELGCLESKLSDTLEAKRIYIGTQVKTFLVKPKSWCLCGVASCPMWIFQMRGQAANRIWSTEGSAALEILDQKRNGYRRLREISDTAGHGAESIWSWHGAKYEETYRQVWTWNEQKKCRETEVSRLINGKLKNTANSCVPE
ncbi:hypothetical protein [Uliginosibacterium sediminicola]|uniref:Uncharacterized protein n=1 Tax=Uliginosibacterium sediminicola TaxID=2024550 RepID=A0ABU9Z2F4_9RHOO